MVNETEVAAKGTDTILFFRLLKRLREETAQKLALQTEHENTKTRDSDSVATKDDPIRVPGSLEIDFSATSTLSADDLYVDQLEEALDDDDIIGIQEIDKTEKGAGDNADRYKAAYYQGYVALSGKSPDVKDTVEVSLKFGINDRDAKGFSTLIVGQRGMVQYVFKDTTIEKDSPEKINSPSVESVAPTFDGASTELS